VLKLHSVSALFFQSKLLSLFRGDELQYVGSFSRLELNIANADDSYKEFILCCCLVEY
jgi:hypothetical protein